MKEQLQHIFQNGYPGSDVFIEKVLKQIFFDDVITNIDIDIIDSPEKRRRADNANILSAIHVIDIDRIGSDPIALYDVTLSPNSNIAHSRVAIKQFIASEAMTFTHAFILFHYDNEPERPWRFSYVYKERTTSATRAVAKRYTYVFGKDYRSRTAVERFIELAHSPKTDIDFAKAFSVEALSDEFFDEYKRQYVKFIKYISGKVYEKKNGKWQDVVYQKPQPFYESSFESNDKTVRDYVKKLFGRIVFMYFLQKKGWLAHDSNYMSNLYVSAGEKQDNFLDSVLEPLFFGVLNTSYENRKGAVLDIPGWDNIPYLNGGLFQEDEIDAKKCMFPGEYFKEFFEFLDRYNFTIDENDPDDAEIGIDPEMLGRIFENLLEDNKDKGAFYTPKEIVQYMCRQSIIEYLKTHSDQSLHADIEDLINKGLVNHALQNKNNARTLYKLLKEVTVCDPAIGSGAFPMGILNILFTARQHLYGFIKESEPFNPLKVKKDIIRDNIYGVDIEQGAVDIARLRFWLAILVEEQVATPLPNLDYRIVRGNSLITTFNDEYIQLPENPDGRTKLAKLKKELHQLQNDLFDLNGDKKLQREIEIKCKILDILKVQLGIDKANAQTESRIESDIFEDKKLSGKSLKKAKQARAIEEVKSKSLFALNNLITSLTTPATPLADRAQIDIKFFDWKIVFSSIFSDDANASGFDIVIGNPPYIDSETMTIVMPDLRMRYADLYSFAKGNWDIYVVFYELGVRLLSKEGILSYIVPNKWLSIGYGKVLRSKTYDYLQTICDCRGVKIFEAGNEPIISIMTKRLSSTITIGRIHDGKQISHVAKVDKSLVNVDNIGLCIAPNIGLLVKIKEQKHTVSDLARVENPFSTSEAYDLIPLIRENPMASNYRLINTGTIDPYINIWGLTKTAYLKNKYDHPQVDQEAFARIFPKRVRQVSAPKIIISGMRHFESYLDSNGIYVAGKSTIIVLSPSYRNNLVVLQGLFNSKLMKFYIYQSFSTLGIGGGINFSRDMVAGLPVPKHYDVPTFISIVQQLVSTVENDKDADISTYLNQIDHIVYHLYDLTYDEVLIVDPQTPISREEYESFRLQ